MAIIWADFPSGQQGIYGTDKNHMLNGVWAGFDNAGITSIVEDPDPNITGNVLKCDNNTIITAGPRFALPAGATATVGIAFRLWMSALPSGNWGAWQGPLIGFRTTGNAAIAYLTVLANGAIAVAKASDGSNLLGTTAGPVVVANAYNHIEIKLTRDAAAGTCEVRVNGVAKLTLAGLALGASDTGIIFVGVNAWNYNLINKGISYYKDIVFWDTSGAYANDFQGSVSVYDLSVNADISLNWAPSSGTTGWNLIDESSPDDTDYIAADITPPAAAVFGLTNLPADVTSIRALLPIMRAQKSDGGDCNVQAGLTPDNVNWVNGADRPMTTAFTYYWSPIHISPTTVAPWTPAEVNAAYVRVNRTL